MASIGDRVIVSKEQLERGELQMSLMKMVAEQNKEMFLEYDCKTDTVVSSSIVNGQFNEIERITGYYSKNNLSVSHIAEEDKELYRKEVERCLKRPMSRVIEVRYLTDDGKKIWHRMYLASVADEDRNVTKLAARIIPVQKEKELQDLMKAQAEHDSLSGVYNHKIYEKVCGELADKYEEDMLFIMIDVDNFKRINDRHGHHVGDSVIRHIGSVLETVVKGRGVAGRMGGDEFSACFYDVKDRDNATNLCIRIKEALRQTPDGVSFTTSIGATHSLGRKMSFSELYFEADQAVYFAKEHGKNQIVFADEIEERRKAELEEERKEYALTDEEITLDQRIDYCIISNPFNKKILYMNGPARTVLGISLEEAREMHCYELFKARESECGVCELHRTHVHVLEGKDSCGLAKYIPDGKFIIQSQYYIWKGEPARLTTFMNVNEPAHLTKCLEDEIESQDALAKCWSLIMEAGLQELEYAKVLEVLNDYYDSDCCTIITKEEDGYKNIFEHHRSSAQGVAEGLHMSLKAGVFDTCEVLIDEEGFMRPRYIKKKLEEYPDVAKMIQEGFVHNTIGIALARQDYMVGILMVLNPKHHVNDYTILKRVGVFFTTDLLRKRLSDVQDYELNHDTLTKLWNREFYMPWVNRFSNRLQKNYGVFTADIFKLGEINKNFGYQTGNERLIELAEVFRRVFEGYSIFRYDDDQILVICHDVEKEAFEKIVKFAKELIEELDFEVSYGYAWSLDGELADVIREAQGYLESSRKQLELENDLGGKLARRVEKDVIEKARNGNFRMFLQPKVSAKTGETVGAEGLIRLFDDQRGFVSPAYFVPILEENNAIHLIDMFMLQRAFQFQAAAKEAGRKLVPISINFSKNTLIFKNLMEYIKELCDTYGMPEGMIIIEITETISNMDHIEVNKIATNLHNMGFAISMDDFGTQYSNMEVLTQFDFDSVKIDRSMIVDIAENEKYKTILKHTINMLKDLGLETIIEGVETKEQVEALKELGCDIIQGFFFGKPEPEERFYELYM